MRHLPTGIEAKSSTRSQHNNKRLAREVLEARVASHYRTRDMAIIRANRKQQAGSGMRGDKIRTYREQDDIVTDHRSETKARLSDVRFGKLEKLLQ